MRKVELHMWCWKYSECGQLHPCFVLLVLPLYKYYFYNVRLQVLLKNMRNLSNKRLVKCSSGSGEITKKSVTDCDQLIINTTAIGPAEVLQLQKNYL